MKNDFSDQELPPEKCLELCNKILACLDHIAGDRHVADADAVRLRVAAAHLQTVIDLLADFQASKA